MRFLASERPARNEALPRTTRGLKPPRYNLSAHTG
jgi:hypothetical protein